MRLKRRGTILLLRWTGIVLLALVLAAFWFREELRDCVVDDTRFAPEIAAAARRNGLDPLLVRSAPCRYFAYRRIPRARYQQPIFRFVSGFRSSVTSGAGFPLTRAHSAAAPEGSTCISPTSPARPRANGSKRLS